MIESGLLNGQNMTFDSLDISIVSQNSSLRLFEHFNSRLFNLFFIFVIIITIVGNIMVVLAVLKNKILQNTTNYFLMSLAIADFLVALLVMPLNVMTETIGYFPFGFFVCNLWVTLDIFLCTSSIWHMSFMSMDRFFTIKFPLKYGRNKTRKFMAFKIVTVWLISLLISSPMFILGIVNTHNVYDYTTLACMPNHSNFKLYGSVFAFYIPFAIITITYASTLRSLKKLMKTKQAIQYNIPTRRTSSRDSRALFLRRERSSTMPGSVRRKSSHKHSCRVKIEKPEASPKLVFKSKSFDNLRRPSSSSSTSTYNFKKDMHSLHMSLLNISYNTMIQNQSGVLDLLAKRLAEKRAVVTKDLMLVARAAIGASATTIASTATTMAAVAPVPPQKPKRKQSFIDKYVLSRFLPDTSRSKQMLDEFNQRNRLGLRLTQLETHMLFGDSESTNTLNNEYFRSSCSPLPSLVEFYATKNASNRNLLENQNNMVTVPIQPIEIPTFNPNLLSIKRVDNNNNGPSGGSKNSHTKRKLIDLYLEMGVRGSFSSNNATSIVACDAAENISNNVVEVDSKSCKLIVSKLSSPTLSQSQQPQQPQQLVTQQVSIEHTHRLVPLLNGPKVVVVGLNNLGRKTSRLGSDLHQSVSGGGGTSAKIRFSCSTSSDYILRNSSLFSGSNIVNNARLRICNKANNERKALKVLIIIFLVFVLFWTPFFIINAVSAFCGERCEFISANLLLVTTWLGYASSSINPVVYTMFNKSFRIAFINLLKCQTKQSNRHKIKEKFLVYKNIYYYDNNSKPTKFV